MTVGMLPPAGDAIALAFAEQASTRQLECWQPYQPVFYASGTAALAAAVAAALAARPGRREVVLPGYGCPALVSAVLHAGGQPVLVDLEAERPWLSLTALTEVAGPKTAAIIAINFLGIPERLALLAELAQAAGALLIDDSAQACPPAGIEGQCADFAVLSFGRGKPVSLLGGGLVLCRDPALAAGLPRPRAEAGSRWRTRLKVLAYNCLRQPQLYWIPQVLPLGLGETRYQPLMAIEAMDLVRQQALGAAIERQQTRHQAIQRLIQIGPACVAPGVTDLAAVSAMPPRLLRYPLLAPSAAARERVLRGLRSAGLGASAMYGSVLPEVAAMPAVPVHGQLLQARDFAARLFTLPVHEGVMPAHVERMRTIIESALQLPKAGLRNYQMEEQE